MNGLPLVTFEGVSKRFPNGVVALDGLDLTVAPGSFTALVGPSGAGKSTLLRLMGRLTQPSAGLLRFSETRPRIGIVFQDPTLMPWARIADNVALPLRLAGMPRAQARQAARKALEDVGIADFSEAYPRALSGGMKMRAALARALITRPHLILLDEPFAALDEITRNLLNRSLLALWTAYRPAVVFITHSIYEAVYLSQTVHVLTARPGRIHASVTIPEPYPRHEDYRLSPQFAVSARAVSDALALSLKDTENAQTS